MKKAQLKTTTLERVAKLEKQVSDLQGDIVRLSEACRLLNQAFKLLNAAKQTTPRIITGPSFNN